MTTPDACPECGMDMIVEQSRCWTCASCGLSACGGEAA